VVSIVHDLVPSGRDPVAGYLTISQEGVAMHE
jgi:hypothetical protein